MTKTLITLEDRQKKIYEWAAQLSTEARVEENYYVTPAAERLERRLRKTRGQRIAVLGLQGTGKSALRMHLRETIDVSISTKWDSLTKIKSLLSGQEEDGYYLGGSYVDEICRAFLDKVFGGGTRKRGLKWAFQKNEALKALKLKQDSSEWQSIDSVMERLRDEKDEPRPNDLTIKSVVRRFEKVIGPKAIQEAKDYAAGNEFCRYSTVLIDFPDYDKRSRGKHLKDMDDFQRWWDGMYEELAEERGGPNLVIFWQKELWGADHFLKGKFDSVVLDPLTSKQLVSYYITRFGGPNPFTEEALTRIAVLARGVWRWFKKYIRYCIDEYEIMNGDSWNASSPIGLEEIRKWITLDQIVEDWKRELLDPFPRSRGNRKKAVMVLRDLQDNGPTPQRMIAERMFGVDEGGKTACTRILQKLEEHGYISREYKGREKIVQLIEVR